jgi:hypothetical protein
MYMYEDKTTSCERHEHVAFDSPIRLVIVKRTVTSAYYWTKHLCYQRL